MTAPRHLALIPDGNRRWARQRGLDPSEGHRAGILHVGEVADAAFHAGVEVVTFWWGSPANLTKRRPEEVAVITGCLAAWLEGPGATLVGRHQAAFAALGRWPELCPAIGPGVEACRAAAGPGPRRLVLLMAYDGREELRAAVAASGGDPTRFERALWTGFLPPVDLVVRTGGEPHLSAGFLAWQIGDAQLAFEEPPWPAWNGLEQVLARFAGTERRLGA